MGRPNAFACRRRLPVVSPLPSWRRGGISRATSLVALALVLAGLPASALAIGSVEKAQAFLAAQQLPSGELAGATAVDDALAAAALDAGATKDALLLGLALRRTRDNESALARVAALAGTPFADELALAALRETILASAAGLAPESSGADPLVLAWAVRVAATRRDDAAFVAASVGQLAALQRVDGGFGFADNASDFSLTAEIATALATIPGVPVADAVASRAVAWLRSQWTSSANLPAADVALFLLAAGPLDAATTSDAAGRLAAHQGVAGDFDADVRATALAIPALRSALPDLVVGASQVMDLAPAVGGTLTMTLNVRNAGPLPSPATEIAATVADSSGAVVFTGQFPVPALAPGAAAAVAASLGVQTTLGPRLLAATVNPTLAFSEARVDNNVATVRYQVSPLPDLVVEPVDIAAGPLPAAVRQELGVTVRVRNVGGSVARNVHAQLFDGDPAAGTLVAETFLNAVAPGLPRTFTARIIPASLDTLHLVARVDPEHSIAEASEVNNSAFVDVKPVAPADITFDLTGSFVGGRLEVKQGVPIEFGCQVAPRAIRYGIPNPDVSLWPFASVEAVVYQGLPGVGNEVKRLFLTSAQILGGYTASISIPTTGWADGAYDFTIVIDPANLVAERDEANNIVMRTVQLVSDDVAELWIDPATLAPEVTPVQPGAAVTFHATLHNTGKQPAVNVPVTVRLLDGTYANLTVPEVLPGAEVDVPVSLTAPPNIGNYRIDYTIDPSGTIPENDKLNNKVSSTIRVGGNLEIVSAVVDPDPTPVDGSPSVRVTVRNTGVPRGTSMTVAVRNHNAVNTTMGSVTTAQYPAPGASVTIPVPITVAGIGGAVYALVTVAATDATVDPLPLVIHLLNPDFAVSAAGIQLDPDPAVSGAPVTPFVVVNNLGALAATPSIRMYRGYPEQGDLVASGSVFVPAGGSATFAAAAFTAPADPPYVITAVVDEEEAYAEEDEANNAAVRVVVKPTAGAVIAFDETHGQGLTSGTNSSEYGAGAYADWVQDLVARGYTVKTLNPDAEGLTAAKLVGVDALVNVLPMSSYSPRELDSLRAFFRNGGGLAFFGDWGNSVSPPPWQAPEEEFLAFLGIQNARAHVGAPAVMCSGDFPGFYKREGSGGGILDHPTTAGVSSIGGNKTGGFSALPASAQVLVRTTGSQQPADMAVAAAFPFEQGRVVVLGDSQFFDSIPRSSIACPTATLYLGGDNRRFALQVIDWLVNGGLKDYLPDLAFAPETIVLDRPVLTAGDQVVAQVTVKNTGGALAAASGAVLRIYDGDAATGTLLGEFTVDTLAVDSGQTFSVTWDTTRRAGERVLTAVVDPNHAVNELFETNNVVSIPVSVRGSNDLRVDPSDVVPTRDGSRNLAVTIHNVGFHDVTHATRLRVTGSTPAGQRVATTVLVAAVPARGSTTVTVPWDDLDATQEQTVTVTADVDGLLTDPTRDDNSARATFRPPALELTSPLPGTLWGGSKEVTWTGSSDENGGLSYVVAIAPNGGPYAGLGSTTNLTLPLDTRGFGDGSYRVRVTASDGFLSTVRESSFVISNAGQAVRVFGSAPGTATATLSTGSGITHVAIPVGSRVTSATMTATPVGAGSSIAPVNGTVFALFDVDDVLWVFTTESNGTNVTLGYRRSLDGGQTWGTRTVLQTFGLTTVKAGAVHNRFGFHVQYSKSGVAGAWYIGSPDGTTWSAPVAVPEGDLAGNDEGLLLVQQGAQEISQGSADGKTWTPDFDVAGVPYPDRLSALVSSGVLHMVAWNSDSIRYYRAAAGADTSVPSAVSPALTLDTRSVVYEVNLIEANGALILAYVTNTNPTGWAMWAQRCELTRDCTLRGSWLPSPVFLGVGNDLHVGSVRPDMLASRFYYSKPWRLNGLEGGTRFGAAAPFEGGSWTSTPRYLFRDGKIQIAGNGQGNTFAYERSPRLSPSDLALDVGAKGTPDAARPGMDLSSWQVPDFAASLNAYVAAHVAEAVGGVVLVPVSVTSSGVGQTTLRNLEVRYELASLVAGFADPQLFSPVASPGILDTSLLSVLSSGPVAVMTPSGAVVRTLETAATGGRYVATFDGRDASGLALPSGPYGFGAPGTPVGGLEIDDIVPTAALDVTADDAFGGAAVVRGTATDRDHAGTAKNFWRYALEYTTDGSTYSPIAASTSPVQAGVLGTWNTLALSAGAATLRLTAWDRAGNSSSATRSVRISPHAPHAPAIHTPTTAAAPIDLAAATTTVSGTGDPGTNVTVLLNGSAVGTVPCDGAWTLAGVALPQGISTIEAVAARGALQGPRSPAITVARYALQVALALPEHAPGGSTVTGTVTVARTSVGSSPVTVRLTARDAVGAAVGIGLTPVEQTLVPTGGGASFSIALGGAGVRAGAYTISADVVAGGLSPARAERVVTFEPLQLLTATLVSDKAVYGALQLVALQARLSNGGTEYTGDLLATITVTPPGAAPVVMGPYPVSPIHPGGSAFVGGLFGVPPLAVGTHAAELIVTDTFANVLATAGTTFEVRASAGPSALSGTLAVTPTLYRVGAALDASWTLTNGGPDGTVDVSLLLVRRDGLVFARHDEQRAVASGGGVASSTLLSTSAADGGELIALLLGNGQGLAAQTVTPDVVVDTSPPVVTISGFEDGEYRSGSVTPVVVVTDESAFTADVKLGDEPFTTGTVVEPDGEYVVSVHAVDALGHTTDAAKSFVIDTIPPEITITGVAAGELARSAVFPVVAVTDLHPASQTILLDGTDWDGLPITAEGPHVLHVHAEDLAGNIRDAEVAFSIDTRPPVVVISGVADGAVYGTAVHPVVSVTDDHPTLPPYAATLGGAAWTGESVSSEGEWTLTVAASDQAGNAAAPATVRFGVDLSPPVIAVTGVSNGLMTSAAVTPVVTITDAHPGTASILLDGAPFVSGTPVTADGDHVLAVSATDVVGHAATPAVLSFTRDSTPPVVSITGVLDGATYYVDASPGFTANDLHLATAVAKLDGVEFAGGGRVTADGWHTYSVTAADLAGSSTTRAVTFRVVPIQASVAATLDAGARVIAVVNCDAQPASCVDAQSRVLKAALSGAGIAHEVVGDASTFLQKVRENRHNVRILYRSSSSATNSYWELRELTFEGGGLVLVNDGAADSDPKLRETIGVGTTGKITSVGSVTISGGDLGPNRTVTVSGSGVAQALQATTAKVAGTASKGLVATTNRYGAGRVVTLTLNPEVNDTPAMRDLLVQTAAFAAGGSLVAGVPGAPQYVKFESALASPGGPLEFELDAWTGTGLVPLSDAGTPVTPPRTWTFPLSAGASASRTVGVSSGQKGTYAVLAELGLTTGQASPRLVASGHVDVTVTGSIAELKANAIAATQAIPAGLNDSAKSSALAQLQAVDPAPTTKAACGTAITSALQATDALKLIPGTEAAGARIKTDQLLRALQVLHPTLP